jgi:hypothetical protein
MGWATFWAIFSQTHLVALQAASSSDDIYDWYAHQGDQLIGRIFAYWAIIYSGHLFEIYSSSPNFFANLFHGYSYALNLMTT